MAILKTHGDWLQSSRWTHALTQAEIGSSGTTDSFLRAAHIGKTRRASQITAAALDMLKHKRDMLNLTNKHHGVASAFAKGMFTVQKRALFKIFTSSRLENSLVVLRIFTSSRI